MSADSIANLKLSGDEVVPSNIVVEQRKTIKVSVVAKSIYRYFLLTFSKVTFDNGRMDGGVLPTFSSKWTKDQCSSMTFIFHNVLAFIMNSNRDLVDDSGNICVKFEIVDIFAGLAGNEHCWNMFTFANSPQKYSIDLSIEQYDASNVTNVVHNPWDLFLNVDNKVFPLNLANKQKITNPDSHKVMFTNPCIVSDITTEAFQAFLTEWDDAAINGFVFMDKNAPLVRTAPKAPTSKGKKYAKPPSSSAGAAGAKAVYTNVTAGECVMLRTAYESVKTHLKIA